ncbi:MAG: PQQ-binding-like beta-propeller repeat protein [Candidatus Berkiella sp.]
MHCHLKYAVALTLLVTSNSYAHGDQNEHGWPSLGGNLLNHSNAAKDSKISIHNINDLKLKWKILLPLPIKNPPFSNPIEENLNFLSAKPIDVTTTPSVKGDTLYITDWHGGVHAVNTKDGSIRWTKNTRTDYASPGQKLPLTICQGIKAIIGPFDCTILGLTDDPLDPNINLNDPNFVWFSRNTPVIDGDYIYIGSTTDSELIIGAINFLKAIGINIDPYLFMNGAVIMKINRHTGDLVWKKKIDDYRGSVVTQSPVIYGDNLFVGVSSRGEDYLDLGYPDYPALRNETLKFRGSLVKLDKKTGKIIGKTYMAPETDFAGNSVFGGQPAVDKEKNIIYVTTGQNYVVPEAVTNCVSAQKGFGLQGTDCMLKKNNGIKDYKDNHFDSVLAIDMKSMKIKWATRVSKYDAFHATYPSNTAPVTPLGPDLGFGSGPILVKDLKTKSSKYKNEKKDVIIAPEKSGIYWVLDANNGKILHKIDTGNGTYAGGILGGMTFGSAFDGEYRVFGTNSHTNFLPCYNFSSNIPSGFDCNASDNPVSPSLLVNLKNPPPTTPVSTLGAFWSAVDIRDGQLLWQNAVPFDVSRGVATHSKGLVFLGTSSSVQSNHPTYMLALDADTGAIVWQYPMECPNYGVPIPPLNTSVCLSVTGSPSVVGDSLYWGVGKGKFFGDSTIPVYNLYSFTIE